MIDLILTDPSEGPATLFTRNFRVHSGLPIGLYSEGSRSPVAMVYGDVSIDTLKDISEHYSAIIAIPSMQNDEIPEQPYHYETMTVKAPILASIQSINRKGFKDFVKTFEGGPLVLRGQTDGVLTLLFTADLIKSTIRILSGEMEMNTGKDSYGRHNPPSENITSSPAVSLHFNLIENVVRYVYKHLGLPLLTIPMWPASAPLAVFLSHDVDVVKKWTVKRSIYELFMGLRELVLFRKKHLSETIFSIIEAIRDRDPYWKFDDLLIMEKGNGFISTWFFAPFGGEFNRRENDFDPIYHRNTAQITSMIRRILENGCEVALHGTRRAFLDANVLKRQLESFENRLGFKLFGVRHHYLMFRHGHTFEAAAEAKFLYDATLGYSHIHGFRNGISSPFFPFPKAHPAGKIVEIPLNFMDGMFINTKDNPEAVMRRVIEAHLFAKAAGGLFSVLIHPGNMDHLEIPELEQFYHSLLSRFRMDHARSMTGAELALWWTKREEVLKTLEYGSDVWRIKGVSLPEDMDFTISAPDIKNMRFVIEGAKGASVVHQDSLTIRPGSIDPEKGITIIKKK